MNENSPAHTLSKELEKFIGKGNSKNSNPMGLTHRSQWNGGRQWRLEDALSTV